MSFPFPLKRGTTISMSTNIFGLKIIYLAIICVRIYKPGYTYIHEYICIENFWKCCRWAGVNCFVASQIHATNNAVYTQNVTRKFSYMYMYTYVCMETNTFICILDFYTHYSNSHMFICRYVFTSIMESHSRCLVSDIIQNTRYPCTLPILSSHLAIIVFSHHICLCISGICIFVCF